MQTVISLDTEKLARRGFQHEGPAPHTHKLKKHGGGWVPRPRGPDAYELLKRLLTAWLGVSTVELCG